MNKVVKIFCRDAEQDKIAELYPVLERYQGFLLAEVAEEKLASLAREYPIEDISSQYILRLGDKEIDTAQPRLDEKGKLRSHPHYKGEKKLTSGFHHHLVQFIGPIKEQWLKKLKSAGAEPRMPLEAFTYVVRANDKTLIKLRALPFVRWIGHLPHSDRIASSALTKAGRKADDVTSDLPRTKVLPGAYVVEFFTGKDLSASLPAIKKLGFEIQSKDVNAGVLVIRDPKNGAGAAKRIKSLSAIHGVRFIRERIIKRTSNNVAAGIMGTEKALAENHLDLSGAGEVIGICDTGIDTADPQNIHPDFSGRITGIKSYPITDDLSRYINNPKGNDGASDLDSGHGTHVAGSVLGDGSVSSNLSNVDKPIRGLSHKAKLYFQAVEQEMQWKNPAYYEEIGRYLLAGIPNDLTKLFADAYKNKVRVHSNSWGGGDPGAYDAQCEQVDRFVWTHKDFCILFANGNDGSDADGDGKINPMSVTSPATSKNCISVGASENERSNFNHNTYGGWWPGDYPVAPYNTDPMANNAEHVVAFSSRGPTADGRIKPDVVAPGTFILSTRSTMLANNNNAWAAFPPSKKYFHMGGTSMATPLAAGAVGLLREYFRTKKNIKSPSAALLKASLIHGALRLPGTTEAHLVDNDQGFGRVNVDAVVSPAASNTIEFLEVSPGLRTGEFHALEFNVQSSETALRLTLVYSDYPGPSLVNNLNLLLIAPDGTRHVGNPKPGDLLTLDVTNNVELIHIENPLTGLWQVEVVASNIPQGPQDFALIYSADIGEAIQESNLIQASSDAMLAIPDRSPTGVSDTINITETGIISNVKVGVDIEHTYIGDLQVSLTGPDGTSVVLHNRSGASNNNLIKSYDVLNTPTLSDLKNSSVKGPWKLSVSDHARWDEGTLRNWNLEIALLASNKIEKTSTPFVAIPDNDRNGISDTINITDSGLVKEIQVSVDITHTWIADLTLMLSAPDGSSVILHKRTGGSLDNIIKTYTTENLPDLANLHSSNVNGDWELKVVDGAGRDVGKLNQWGLVIST